MKSVSKRKIYKVGISGHRDLKTSKIPEYREEVIDTLMQIITKYEDREVSVITPLAEGADRLVAECAMVLGLSYEVLLPMPVELYVEDFKATEDAFLKLCDTAVSVETLPLYDGNTLLNIKEYGDGRDKQYAYVGHQIVDRSDAMIFLWDGTDNGLKGGTADIKNYAVRQNKLIHHIQCEREGN